MNDVINDVMIEDVSISRTESSVIVDTSDIPNFDATIIWTRE